MQQSLPVGAISLKHAWPHFIFWWHRIIVLSGCFGLLVSLSTFLMIGATSALTYNIVGHLKTVCILLTGFFLFRDSMGFKKCLGILCALVGVFWYSKIKLDQQQSSTNLPKVDVESGGQREGLLADARK